LGVVDGTACQAAVGRLHVTVPNDAKVILRTTHCEHGTTLATDLSGQKFRYFEISGLSSGVAVKVYVCATRSQGASECCESRPSAVACVEVIAGATQFLTLSADDFQSCEEEKPEERTVHVFLASTAKPKKKKAAKPEKEVPDKTQQSDENDIHLGATGQLEAFVKYGDDDDGGVADSFMFARGVGQSTEKIGVVFDANGNLTGVTPEPGVFHLEHRFTHPRNLLSGKPTSGTLRLKVEWKGKNGELRPPHDLAQVPVKFSYPADGNKGTLDKNSVSAVWNTALKQLEAKVFFEKLSVRDNPASITVSGYVLFTNGPAVTIKETVTIKVLSDTK
jgi:hypothetical protein